MAQQALAAGTTVPRRRALFGLLDADGWALGVGQGARLVRSIIILMLGYLPDRAYYLTVGRTVDLGVLVWSPINLCPPENETLPCPAPVGAIVPWEPSPAELALPRRGPTGPSSRSARSCSTSAAPTARRPSRRSTSPRRSGPATSTSGPTGPALPAPRDRRQRRRSSPAASTSSAASDADGAPTDTVFVLTPDGTTGELGRVEDAPDDLDAARGPRRAPPRSPTADGLLLIGGSQRERPGRPRPGRSLLDNERRARQVGRGAAARRRRRPTRPPRSSATTSGCTAAATPNGPVGAVQRGDVRQAGRRRACPTNPDEGKVDRAGRSTTTANLPGAADQRRGLGAPTARSTSSAAPTAPRPTSEVYWAVPTTDGDIAEWKHLAASDLPAPDRRRAGRRQRPERVPRRRRRPTRRRRRHRASGRTSPRSRRSSSSASSGRPCRGSRSRARSASSSAT